MTNLDLFNFDKDMSETSDQIIFIQKTLFRAMKQPYGDLIMLKSKEEVAKAQFTNSIIDLRIDHEDRVIGEVRNINLVGDEWKGDVIFIKSKMTEEELSDIRTLKKRDLSIGFFNTPVKSNIQGIDIEQTDLLIEEVSWVEEGRCSFPLCGLDKTSDGREKAKEIISLSNPITDIDWQKMSKTLLLEIDQIKAKEKTKQTEVNKLTTDCNKQLDDMAKAYDSFKNDHVKDLDKANAELKIAKDQIDTLTLDHKTEIDSLNADLEKKNAALELYKKIEKDSLSKTLMTISTFTEEEVKEMSLDSIKKDIATLKKGKHFDSVDITIEESNIPNPKDKDKPTGVDLKSTGPTDLFAMHQDSIKRAEKAKKEAGK